MQDRPKGCLLCNPPVSEIQEVCQVSVERPSIRVLFLLLRALSSSLSFYKAIKIPYLSLEKAQCKNNNLPLRHATNGIFIRGLVEGKRYTDIHTQSRQSETFVKNWERLANDPMILDIVRGYEIPFILPPRQSRLPNLCQLTKEASDLVHQEVLDMLRKGTIVVSDPKEDQFLSSLFLMKKKDRGIAK